MELKDLVGTTILQGCEWGKAKHASSQWREPEDVDVIHFKLGPTTYSMYEDPDDGYRSHLGTIEVDKHEIKNTFAPCVVKVTHRTSRPNTWDDISETAVDILEIRCAETGKVIIEVGTDNTDDYYPSCVMSFTPGNLIQNQDVPSPGEAGVPENLPHNADVPSPGEAGTGRRP